MEMEQALPRKIERERLTSLMTQAYKKGSEEGTTTRNLVRWLAEELRK
ncbi:hypothetical protein [Jeotgalibacillus campisalis]|uniref:Uncharacterized protein n=1 Tax=Jeotgalibacillus campisalis TaxID=220754 RepID=A0A0C2RN24_9BACL|nr:hypothetical protein [Jeotgalibacillus campisalis]KIL43174.1 hypothetical protein KR50_35770 [Jeotgalibacillus campisalis]